MKMESDARRTKAGGNDGGNEDRSRNRIEDRKRPCLVLIDPSSLRWHMIHAANLGVAWDRCLMLSFTSLILSSFVFCSREASQCTTLMVDENFCN